MKYNRDITQAMQEVREELLIAVQKFPPMHSAHEGFAVIHEEFDELKAEIWKNPERRDIEAMHAEAVQLAAMCVRLMVDITLPALQESHEAARRLEKAEKGEE